MKHVNTLSSVKPVEAQEAAWFTLGNFFKAGGLFSFIGDRGGRANDAGGWIAQLIDDLLQG